MVQQADVRVVATTNADLTALVARGQYRQDLLFRLELLPLGLPPLRERGDDARLLAEAFVGRFSRQYGTGRKTLHRDTLAFLARHKWPGNVRELENLIHREFLLGTDDELRITGSHTAGDSHAAPDPSPSLTTIDFRAAKARSVADFERAYLVELLGRTNGNLSLAARMSGKDRSRLGKMIRKYGLTRSQFAQV